MKKFFLSIIFVFSTFLLNAQTIHWLTFIDTKDPNVGMIDKNGRNVLYNRFINIVNSALAPKGYKSDIHDIYDSNLSPERCKLEVMNLECEDDDIIVFYYIGHGTHSPNDNNPYPQLLLGSSDEKMFIPLKWVHKELKNKGARLAVTIGMCCNVIQNVSSKNAPMFSVNYGNVELTENELRSIQKMFLGYKGDLILTSASLGQSSLGGRTPFGDMDLFTAILVTVFEDQSYDGSLGWNSLFEDVKNIVNSETQFNQTPFWESNLTLTSIPPKRSSITTQTKKVVNKKVQNINPGISSGNEININDISGICNYLSSHFDCMIDNTNTWSIRKNEISKISSLFSSDAVVKIIPQDFDSPVIDKENIKVFLGRISSNEGRIIKIIPISYKFSNNKITELKVKECYYK